jgi:hypothetical protein
MSTSPSSTLDPMVEEVLLEISTWTVQLLDYI